MEDNKPVLVRITTVALSLRLLLSGQMKYMTEKGFKVYMVSNPDPEIVEKLVKEEECEHIPVSMTRRITPLRDFISLIRLVILFKKLRPEIVHTHTPKAGLLGMMAARICSIPVRVHTVAGLPVMESKGIKKMILSYAEGLTYNCATQIVPNSKGIQNYILNKNWISLDKINFLGKGSSNGVEVKYFSPSEDIKNESNRIRSHLKINDEAFVFLFIGRIVADKGINELLQSFVNLNEDQPNVKLILAGPFENNLDPIKKSSKRIIDENSNINYVGFVEDVRPYLALSNALVLPSYREGFPNAPLQAAAMGIPSIVTDIIGCNEIIRDEENGLLVKVKDVNSLTLAMERMTADKQWTVKLGTQARESIIENYDRSFVQSKIYDLYSTLLKSVLNVSPVHQTIS